MRAEELDEGRQYRISRVDDARAKAAKSGIEDEHKLLNEPADEPKKYEDPTRQYRFEGFKASAQLEAKIRVPSIDFAFKTDPIEASKCDFAVMGDEVNGRYSIPKPTSEMLPACTPATTATSPSRLFHAMVKYSKRFPCRAIAWRSMVSGYCSSPILVDALPPTHQRLRRRRTQAQNPIERYSDRGRRHPR
jgi:hypothetical protein